MEKKVKAAGKTPVTKKTTAKKAAPAKRAATKKAAPAKKVAAKTKAVNKTVETVAKTIAAAAGAKIAEDLTKKAINPAPEEQEAPVGQKVEKVRYSDAELQEFKELILQKLAKAHADYDALQSAITHSSSNDTEDTSPTFKVLEEGASSLNREENGALAQRQYKFIQNLEAALVRIENKTYGIDRVTGKLIPKERLRLVPHATMDVESKNESKK